MDHIGGLLLAPTLVVSANHLKGRAFSYSAPGPVGGCVDVCGCVCVRASVAHRCLPTVRRRVGHAGVAEEAAYYSTAVV